MDRFSRVSTAIALAVLPVAAAANPVRQTAQELPAYLECVPYARAVSGIQIYGDAWTWWDQAEGRYARGTMPKAGAVMAFVPHGNMRLGHVAAVSRVIDRRTVLLRHANWSPIDGRRGQVEDDVRAVDVSPANDWSAVRVWYAPLGDVGTTVWPVSGFIYPAGQWQAPRLVQAAAPAPPPPVRPSGDFLNAFADLGARSVPAAPVRQLASARIPASPTPLRQLASASAPVDLLSQVRR